METAVINLHETLNKLFFLDKVFFLIFKKNVKKSITYNSRKFGIFKKTNVVHKCLRVLWLFWTETPVCHILVNSFEVHCCDVLLKRNINFSIQILYINELFYATIKSWWRDICGPRLRCYQWWRIGCLWNFVWNLARIGNSELRHVEHVKRRGSLTLQRVGNRRRWTLVRAWLRSCIFVLDWMCRLLVIHL